MNMLQLVICKILCLSFLLPSTRLLVNANGWDETPVDCKPEHVHLSYGNTAKEMVVMWETQKPCSSEVQYGDHPFILDLSAKGKTEDRTSCGGNNCSLNFVHRVVLQDLKPSATIYYRPLSEGISAGSFYFHVPANKDTDDLQFFITSYTAPVMIKSLVKAVYSHPPSAIFLFSKPQELVCKQEENVLSLMEDITKNFPVMVGADSKPEDAECARSMFSLPGQDWPQTPARWYSLDIGLVHLIVYSSSVFLEKDPNQGKAMQAWLLKDLNVAKKKRSQTPWIIAIGSDPMYCQVEGTHHSDMDCVRNDSRIRYGLEDIFYSFAVDLVFEFQYGVYERTWPHYKSVVTSRSYEHPAFPVEVILSGGNPVVMPEKDVGNETVNTLTADWSALRLNSGGDSYGHLSVANASHLYFEWRSAGGESETVLDKFWLVQEQHGNFSLAMLPHDVGHRINQSIIAMGGKPGTYDFINTLTPDDSEDGEGWSKYSLWFGLCLVGAAIFIGLGMVTVRSYLRRRRNNVGRRWREVDCQGSGGGHFYSMASDTDSDGENDHDFEIDMFARTSKSESKLLTSY